MKKIIHFTILFVILLGITACTPKETITPTPNANKSPIADLNRPIKTRPAVVLKKSCAIENGKWLSEYQECEGISKTACEKIGGKFNECASACRHDPKADVCTMQCVLVCEFNNANANKPITPDVPSPQIVGGDKDEHGCIGSAGYSWCENKQKCLRTWEEPCDEDLSGAIQQLFADKYKKPLSGIKVTIAQSTEQFARGGVLFGQPGVGEGGNFLAVKTDGNWKLVFDGNGGIACKDLEKYQFPEEMIKDICSK